MTEDGMQQMIIQRRVRSYQLPACTNAACGARERQLHRLRAWCTTAYTAYRCQECGEYVVEGDVLKFCRDMSAKLQADEKRRTLFSVTEQMMDRM